MSVAELGLELAPSITIQPTTLPVYVQGILLTSENYIAVPPWYAWLRDHISK